MAADERAQRVGVQPVVVARHRDELGARHLEALERRQVGGLLDEDAVAGLQQDGGDERQRLLGPAGDEHVVGVGRQAARAQPGGDGGAQRGVALGRRVLQRATGALVRQDGGERGGGPGGVEELGGRQAAGERDDARLLGEGEDLADRRAGDVAQPGGRGRRRRGDGPRAHR